MKKSSSLNAVSASLRFWRALAILSVCIIGGLVFAILKELRSLAEPTVPPVAELAPALATPSGPYAALGSYVAENNRLAELGWNKAQFEEFLEGMRASYEGRGLPLDDEAKKLRDEFIQRGPGKLASEPPDSAEDYFRMLRENEGAQRTESGLHYRVTAEGSGPHPKPDDVIVLSFSVQQPDGQERPELNGLRLRTRVGDLLPGLAEGVQLLSVGGKALLYLPAELSFDAAAWPQAAPKGMTLVFSVELHEIAEPASL